MRRVLIGGDHSLALAALMPLFLAASKNAKPRTPTAEQIVAQDKRTERQRWNDEVERRKADKKAAKGERK